MKWEVSLTGHSSKKVAHAKIRVSANRRSEELSSNFREDMAPISAAIVLQERGDGSKKKKGRRSFFFNFLKNESNLRWTAKGKWTAADYSAATFSREVQGEQQEY